MKVYYLRIDDSHGVFSSEEKAIEAWNSRAGERTSMRLYDLDEIKVCIDRQYENCHGYSGSKKAIYREAILAVKSILHSAKPIDAVPVVHCRECNHCDPENYHCDHPMSTAAPLRRKPDDFCSYGKRKEGSDNG